MAVRYENDAVRIEVFVSGFSNNAWLLTDKATNQSLIIDTPSEPRALVEAARKTDVTCIVFTHNHWDHLDGFDDVRDVFRVAVGIGASDAREVERKGVRPTVDVSDGAEISFGDLILQSIETPGHTPGSICYYLAAGDGHVFSGDTLFPGGPGRTTSPRDFAEIVRSIREKLLPLPPETTVHPGHGDDTTIREARAEYEAFAAKHHRPDLCGNVTWLSD